MALLAISKDDVVIRDSPEHGSEIDYVVLGPFLRKQRQADVEQAAASSVCAGYCLYLGRKLG